MYLTFNPKEFLNLCSCKTCIAFSQTLLIVCLQAKCLLPVALLTLCPILLGEFRKCHIHLCPVVLESIVPNFLNNGLNFFSIKVCSTSFTAGVFIKIYARVRLQIHVAFHSAFLDLESFHIWDICNIHHVLLVPLFWANSLQCVIGYTPHISIRKREGYKIWSCYTLNNSF